MRALIQVQLTAAIVATAFAAKAQTSTKQAYVNVTIVSPSGEPVVDTSFISMSSQGNAQNVFVYDITGRELGCSEIKNGSGVLNTSTYSSGIYLYRIADIAGNVIDLGKFVVTQ